MLRTEAAICATHDAGQGFQRPGCHKNARIAVMDRLRDWLLFKFKPKAVFLWFYGVAGAGKSSISQTFEVRSAEERHLLGNLNSRTVHGLYMARALFFFLAFDHHEVL